MARPDGSILPGEWTLPLCYATSKDTYYTETDPCYMYFVFRLPQMPKEFQDTATTPTPADLGFDGTLLPRRIVTAQETYLDDAGENLFSEGRSARTALVSWTRTTAGAVDPPDWQTADEDDDYETECLKFTNLADSDPDPPLIGWVELKLWSDAAGNLGGVELCAVDISTVCDTADSNTIQYYSRTTRMYDPDYPADAHMVCDVLINAYIRLLYENCPAFSLPVHGRSIPDPS